MYEGDERQWSKTIQVAAEELTKSCTIEHSTVQHSAEQNREESNRFENDFIYFGAK